MSTIRFRPSYAVQPGAILEEWLQGRGESLAELALKLPRSVQVTNGIIQGRVAGVPHVGSYCLGSEALPPRGQTDLIAP